MFGEQTDPLATAHGRQSRLRSRYCAASRKAGKMPGACVLPMLLLAASVAASRPSYLITTPVYIRPGLNVTLGISLLAGSQPEVRVTAEIIKDIENTTVLRGEGLFQTGSFGTLILPALPMNSVDQKYTLHVKGYAEDKIVFSNSTSLEFDRKGCFVFIQTDKSLYKPGQEVKMRIVTVLLDLRPYKASLNIHIRDPRGNLIEQWLEEQGDLGVVSQNFKLSAHPLLGDWSIQVQVNQQTHFQTFTVMEYVLPKFEVLITASSHHSMKENKLTGIITAKYTYGKPVKGTALVVLANDVMKTHIRKTYEINGSVTFTFNYPELKTFFSYHGRLVYRSSVLSMNIIAVVTESLTGISQNTSSPITFTEHDYAIEFLDYPQVLKPSLNLTAKLKIMRYDNSLLTTEERRNNVAVTVMQSGTFSSWRFLDWEMESNENGNVNVNNYTIPENDIIQIEVPLKSYTRVLKIKASFLSAENEITVANVFTSPSMAYIEIKKERRDYKVGMPFELIIHSSKPIIELNYQVVSRGQIVAVGKKSSSTFTLTPESSWTPVALIIVFYIQDDGEVVNDIMSFPIQPVFENKVSISWSTVVARPSEKVSLTMTASEPDSLIGLSVVDKSVKLLGDRNDITAENVIVELASFTDDFHGAISNSLEVFEKGKLCVLTDATLVLKQKDDWHFTNYDEEYFEMDSDILYHPGSKNQPEDNSIPPLGEFPGSSSPKIRLFFPETWLWMDSNIGPGAEATLDVTVPDTITTWVANAFIISEHLGLGIAAAPVQLQAFQPFFVSLNLPYSVTRGEQFVLEVIIFNYLEETSEVTVTLLPSDAFDVIISSNDINATQHQHTVYVPRQDGRTVMFPVKTNQLGEIAITVKATSPAASDAVTQKVLVKAEGIEQFFSKTILLDLTSNNTPKITETLTFTFPSNVVSGSERVYIVAVGDILGPSISGLESLIRMPYGCGEQNMINFAPNIYILDYLTKTNQLKDETTQKSILFMKEGYQRELLYQRYDGSFSAFGNMDSSGSTWLSSFVLRCFLQARAFIYIDPSVLQKTITWIFRYQKRNGEFWEPGKVLHTSLKGGISSPITLTAYIASAIAEYPGHEESSQFRSAIKYLESRMDEEIVDSYALAIVTYALSLAGSSKAKDSLDTLNRRAEQQGDLRFWATASSKLSDSWQPSSTDIELAAYALLSHVQQKRLAEGIPIMKWLSQQRNHLGGFSSTQDTILALQALSTFASLATIRKTEISVSVNGTNLKNIVEFKIDDQNRLLLQTEQIEVAQPLAITVSAHGTGLAVLQLNMFYNVIEESTAERRISESQDAFDLDISVQDDKNDIHRMTLNVCTRFLGTDTSSESGMALMQVNFLSGFALSPDSISLNSAIMKVENGNGNVNLYFDSLNKSQMCVVIPAVRDSKVAYTKEASVSVVDYYEPRRRASRSYNSEVMQELSPCAFCKEDCDVCNKDGSTGMMNHSTVFVLFFTWFVIHFML